MASPMTLPPVYRPSGAAPDPNALAFKPVAPKMGPADLFKYELLASGLPAHVVDGIMMNGRDESGFDPSAVGDNGNAFGILQWNGPRKRALEQFAASIGGSAADPAVQAKFTVYELQGPEKAAYDKMMATTTAGEAGAAFVNHYERPAEEHRARREAAYLGGTVPAGGWGGPASTGDFGNALAAPPADPANALADKPKAPEVKINQMDPAAFMRPQGNALAAMQPLTYQRRGSLG